MRRIQKFTRKFFLHLNLQNRFFATLRMTEKLEYVDVHISCRPALRFHSVLSRKILKASKYKRTLHFSRLFWRYDTI